MSLIGITRRFAATPNFGRDRSKSAHTASALLAQPPLLPPAERLQRAETSARRAQRLGDPPTGRDPHRFKLRQRAFERSLQLARLFDQEGERLALLFDQEVERRSEFGSQTLAFRNLQRMSSL